MAEPDAIIIENLDGTDPLLYDPKVRISSILFLYNL